MFDAIVHTGSRIPADVKQLSRNGPPAQARQGLELAPPWRPSYLARESTPLLFIPHLLLIT